MVEIANAFAARGYAIDVLVLKPVGQLEGKVDARITIVSLDAGRIIFSLPKLITYLRREKPETLLALDEFTHLMALLARPIASPKTRIVLRIGNMLTELFKRYTGFKNKMVPFFIRLLYRYADLIVANSRGVADNTMLVTGIHPNRVKVIYNPKSLETIVHMSKEPSGHMWLESKTVPVILAVGRLRIQKNFSLVISAFSKVVKKIPSRLIIVGAGREEGRLLELAKKLGCAESVSLVGYSDNPYAYMGEADVFVSASLWEGMPNALLEALVCKMPVIASDCSSGPREILAPNTDYLFRLTKGIEYAKYGVLTTTNDESALVEALTAMLTDASLRGRYSVLSKERIKDFDSEKIIDEYAEALGLLYRYA